MESAKVQRLVQAVVDTYFELRGAPPAYWDDLFLSRESLWEEVRQELDPDIGKHEAETYRLLDTLKKLFASKEWNTLILDLEGAWSAWKNAETDLIFQLGVAVGARLADATRAQSQRRI